MTQTPDTRVPLTADEATAFLLTLLAALVGLLTVALFAKVIGPYLRRHWPRTAEFISNLLPLPCDHTDADGTSLTYRERRLLNGTLVMHLVCETCGYARPNVDRTDDEHRGVVTARPAHEQMRARLKPPPAPPASTLQFDVTKRSGRR